MTQTTLDIYDDGENPEVPYTVGQRWIGMQRRTEATTICLWTATQENGASALVLGTVTHHAHARAVAEVLAEFVS